MAEICAIALRASVSSIALNLCTIVSPNAENWSLGPGAGVGAWWGAARDSTSAELNWEKPSAEIYKHNVS